jgi:hypothetical protein
MSLGSILSAFCFINSKSALLDSFLYSFISKSGCLYSIHWGSSSLTVLFVSIHCDVTVPFFIHLGQATKTSLLTHCVSGHSDFNIIALVALATLFFRSFLLSGMLSCTLLENERISSICDCLSFFQFSIILTNSSILLRAVGDCFVIAFLIIFCLPADSIDSHNTHKTAHATTPHHHHTDHPIDAHKTAPAVLHIDHLGIVV